MHPIAHQLQKIGRDDIERGQFSPDDFRAILTALNILATEVLGPESSLVEHIDDALGSVNDAKWPDGEDMCHQCSGSGEGMTEGARCLKCGGRGVVRFGWGDE